MRWDPYEGRLVWERFLGLDNKGYEGVGLVMPRVNGLDG